MLGCQRLWLGLRGLRGLDSWCWRRDVINNIIFHFLILIFIVVFVFIFVVIFVFIFVVVIVIVFIVVFFIFSLFDLFFFQGTIRFH